MFKAFHVGVEILWIVCDRGMKDTRTKVSHMSVYDRSIGDHRHIQTWAHTWSRLCICTTGIDQQLYPIIAVVLPVLI
jgi:hypothetical protein